MPSPPRHYVFMIGAAIMWFAALMAGILLPGAALAGLPAVLLLFLTILVMFAIGAALILLALFLMLRKAN